MSEHPTAKIMMTLTKEITCFIRHSYPLPSLVGLGSPVHNSIGNNRMHPRIGLVDCDVELCRLFAKRHTQRAPIHPSR